MDAFASKEVQKERTKICEKCEFNKFELCMKCGCILALKITLKSSNCPINKWSEV